MAFALFQGSSALLFSLFGGFVSRIWVSGLNIAVAVVLIVYGSIRVRTGLLRMPEAG